MSKTFKNKCSVIHSDLIYNQQRLALCNHRRPTNLPHLSIGLGKSDCWPVKCFSGSNSIAHSLRARPGGIELDRALVPGPGARELGRTFSADSLVPAPGDEGTVELISFPLSHLNLVICWKVTLLVNNQQELIHSDLV
jgi:hypothetical protein